MPEVCRVGADDRAESWEKPSAMGHALIFFWGTAASSGKLRAVEKLRVFKLTLDWVGIQNRSNYEFSNMGQKAERGPGGKPSNRESNWAIY